MIEGFWWGVGATLGYGVVWLLAAVAFLVLLYGGLFLYLIYQTHKIKKERAANIAKQQQEIN